MCNIIVINRGEKEIESPRQFLEHFGFMPDRLIHPIEMDACLCHCDIEKAFNDKDIPFKKDCGDFFVGQLDQVKGDND